MLTTTPQPRNSCYNPIYIQMAIYYLLEERRHIYGASDPIFFFADNFCFVPLYYIFLIPGVFSYFYHK